MRWRSSLPQAASVTSTRWKSGRGVYLDFDHDGRVIALELLDASWHIPLDELKTWPSPAILLTLAEAAKESGHSPATLASADQSGPPHSAKKGAGLDRDARGFVELLGVPRRPRPKDQTPAPHAREKGPVKTRSGKRDGTAATRSRNGRGPALPFRVSAHSTSPNPAS